MEKVSYRIEVHGEEGKFFPQVFITTDYGYCLYDKYYYVKDTWETKEKAKEVGEQIAKRLIREQYGDRQVGNSSERCEPAS